MPLFSHPAAAWLLPAIVLPILFHLFFRLRRQTHDFPALLFFTRIDPRLSAKRKIHEWIILLLRCLFIALLLLAVMRPLLNARNGGGSITRLVLLDNSGSMAGVSSAGISKWTLAQRAAQQLASTVRPGDALAVQLAVPDPTAALPAGFEGSAAQLRDAVGKLVVSDGAASIPKAMRRALALLDSARTPRRELIIITDLQRDNWSRGEIPPEPTAARIIVRRIPSAPLTAGSVALHPLELPTRSIPAGRVVPLRVSLENAGPGAAHVRLNTSDDSGRNQSREMDVAPHGTSSATLTFSFTAPGFHWAEEWLEGDASPAGHRAEVGFWCTEARKVLFVGGKDDFGALPYAVSPGGNADLSGISSVFATPNQLALLADHPLAVVTTWDQIDPALESYIRAGGTLLLVPKPDPAAPAAAPGWIGTTLGAAHAAAEPEPMLALQPADNLWHDLRDSAGRPQLGTLRVWQYRPIESRIAFRPLLASGHGATLLAQRNLDHGRILASGIAFTPKWSSLPLKADFVVLVQNAVFNDRAEPVPVHLLNAGEELSLPDGPLSIKSLAGSALAWQGASRNFAGFPRAGVYEVRERDHVESVAVSANPAEARDDFLPAVPVPLLRNLPHDVLPLAAESDIMRDDLSAASATSFYRWLLLAALLVLLAETWLAHERSSDLGRKLFQSLLRAPARTPSKSVARV